MSRIAVKSFFRYKFEICFFAGIFILSCLFFWHTFRLDSSANLLIGSRLWSDFGATIPLIRSFSLGSNFPPEYPIFSGEPIRYHFVFFALVGLLEKSGIPLDFALNFLSAASFTFLLFSIYLLAKFLFGKRVGVISIILFLFNGSLGFLEYFKTHPLTIQTLVNIPKTNEFTSFGPYDGKIVSAFWSLNIYTNQRHLAFGYACLIFLIYLYGTFAKDPKKYSLGKSIAVGILIGVFPFIHAAAFGMMMVAVGIFFLIYPKLRKFIFLTLMIAGILALPQFAYMGSSQVVTNFFNPGYLVEHLNAIAFAKYWFLNLGMVLILAPLGFIFANKSQRKLLLPFLAFFIVGNIFQFSPDLPTNHKFFNMAAIGAIILTSYSLVILWKKSVATKILVAVVFPLLVLSGIIDFFPILNDRFITAPGPNSSAIRFINEATPKNSKFLNSSFLYNPASLAGRKIFMGWPYFAWSAGYDTQERGAELSEFFSTSDPIYFCQKLTVHNLDYFMIEKNANDPNFPSPNYQFFQSNFDPIYEDQLYLIYPTSSNCNSFK